MSTKINTKVFSPEIQARPDFGAMIEFFERSATLVALLNDLEQKGGTVRVAKVPHEATAFRDGEIPTITVHPYLFDQGPARLGVSLGHEGGHYSSRQIYKSEYGAAKTSKQAVEAALAEEARAVLTAYKVAKELGTSILEQKPGNPTLHSLLDDLSEAVSPSAFASAATPLIKEYLRTLNPGEAPNLTYEQYYEYAWLLSKQGLPGPLWQQMQPKSIVIDKRLQNDQVIFHGDYIDYSGKRKTFGQRTSSIGLNVLGTVTASVVEDALAAGRGDNTIAARFALAAAPISIGSVLSELGTIGFPGVDVSFDDHGNPFDFLGGFLGSIVSRAFDQKGSGLTDGFLHSIGASINSILGLPEDSFPGGLVTALLPTLGEWAAVEILKSFDSDILAVIPAQDLAAISNLGPNLAIAAARFIANFMADEIIGAIFHGDPESIRIGARIGGIIGSAIGEYFGGPIGSVIGEFIGKIVGAALGSLFGPHQTWGEVDVIVSNGLLAPDTHPTSSGKALEIATGLAGAAIQYESAVLNTVGGRLKAMTNASFSMDEQSRTISVRVGGTTFSGEAMDVVERGAIAQLKSAQIAGGDIVLKRALGMTSATTAAGLNGDLSLAALYEFYHDNKQLFLKHVDEIMAGRGGGGEAAWNAERARAENVLDLDGAFTASFYRTYSQVAVPTVGSTSVSAVGSSGVIPSMSPLVGTPYVPITSLPASQSSDGRSFSAPLVALDLNRDGVIATDIANSGTLFDIDGDGYLEQTGWLTPFDGFLVFDTNNDGEINSIAEMAVSQTVADALGNPLGIAMASLDSNGNGYFDAGDSRFFEARVWTDRNLDGSVDFGELWSLTRFGIDYMSLRGTAVSHGDNAYRESDGNRIAWESAYGIIGDDPQKTGIFTTLSLGYEPMGLRVLEDAQNPAWFILDHEGGGRTAFGVSEGNLSLSGLAVAANTVFGGAGNDYLSPTAGNVAGEAGVFVDGKDGNDTVIGGAGDDVLTGGAGIDSITGGEGDDIVTADDQDVLANISGGAGHDALIYNGSNALDLDISTRGFEVAIGGSGNDQLRSSVDDVVLAGGAGNDTLVGAAGEDQLQGDEGDDVLTGNAGDDLLSGGAGIDTLNGGEGDDILFVDAADFSGSVQRVTGGAGFDMLVVEGTEGVYADLSAAGAEAAVGGGGADRLRAGSGSDGKILYGQAGDDVLVSGAGADELVGGDGIDVFSYEDSNASVNVNLKTHVVSGGHAVGDVFASVEGVIGSQYADTLTGDDGDNILEGGLSADILDGGAGRDAASYRSSNAAVTVNLATNARSGGHAAGDTFTSIENLIGSAYNDTLTGSATDNVIEGGAGADTLAGGLGIDTVSYRGSSAGVTVNLLTNAVSGGDAAGDVLSGFENVTGSQFDDTLIASNVANAFDGLGGTDTVSYAGTTAGVAINLAQGLGGDGAAGDKYFNIENATGGSGNDVLTGDASANVLKGGDGDDTLNGGTGDRLEGELGNDTYTFGTGSGVIVIDDTGGLDAIRFGQGITLDDLQIEAREGDVFIGLRDSRNPYADVSVLTDRLEIRGAQAAAKAVERLVFADGSEMFLQTVGAGEKRLVGSDGNNLLIGDQGDNTLEGGAGKDWLFGGNGNDWLYGGADDDTLEGGAGKDWLFGGDGNDILFGGDGDDTLIGGEGDDVLLGGPGDDVLDGGPGDDVLDGGAGNDILKGGTGFDVYVQRAGGGYDRVYDADGLGRFEFIVDTTFYGVSNTNSLNAVFGNWTNFIGVTPSADPYNANWWIDVTAYFADATYSFGILPTELQSHSTAAPPTAYIWSSTAVTRSLYTPGYWVRWDLAPEEYQATLTTNFQSDWMPNRNNPSQPYGVWPSWHPQYGWNNVNNLFTRFDLGSLLYVRPFGGGDFITGTEGNDSLSTLDGDDQVYGYGGNDTINGGNGDDALSGGEGVDTLLGGNGNDSIDGGNGNDIIKGEAGSDTLAGGAGTDTIEGGDGIDYIDGGDGVDTLRGGNGNDQVAGGTGNDNLYGDAGDDKLYGDEGDDKLYGGLGEDVLIGYSGNDRLEGEDGDDQLSGGDGNDTLLGGEGRDSLYGNSGNDILDGGNGDDSLSGNDGIDTLTGGAGNDHLSGGNDDDQLDGGIGNDDLWGGAGHDKLLGGTGDDQLSGEAGDDQLFGGDGVDTIVGDEDKDRLYGEAGDDKLYGGTENDSLLGGDGNDALSGWTGDDVLWGQAGDDALAGGDDNDKLFGGEGSDVLLGGNGNDDLSGGAGVDLMTGGAGNDRMWGGADQDMLSGDDGDDTLVGGAGDDQLSGDAGADRLYGGDGVDNMAGGADNDTLLGGAGDDRMAGDAGDDKVAGGDGNDQVSGGLGDDTLVGEAGNDSLVGNAGADKLLGGDGDDTLIGDWPVENGVPPEGTAGNDQIWGGAGNDGLLGGDGDDYLDGGADDDILDGGKGADLLVGGAGKDILAGGEGDDRLSGGNDNDQLFGGLGNDAISGGSGDDALRGEAGDDRLDGGAGSDNLAGGAGSDAFVFASGFGTDRITDFSVTEDYIDLINMTITAANIVAEGNGARLKIGTSSVFVDGVTPAALLSRVRTIAAGSVTVDTSTAPVAPTWSSTIETAAPSDPFGLSWSLVAENAVAAEIGQLVLDPVASGVTRTITVSDNRFQVVNGILKLKSNQKLDFEVAQPYVLVTVTVTDTGSPARSQQFRVDITNVNEAPTIVAVSALSVAENAKGAVIGTVTSVDPDAGDTVTYTVTDAGNRFEIVNGELRLKAGVSLDFEATPTVPITITATDAGGLIKTTDFTVNVANVNEKPLSIGLSSSTLAATPLSQNGAIVGALSAVDPDAGDTRTFAVSDNRFEVVSGQLKLKSLTGNNLAALLAAAASPWLAVDVTVTDAGGLVRHETFFLSAAATTRQTIQDGNGGRLGDIIDRGNGQEDRLWIDAQDSESWAYRDERWQKQATTTANSTFNTTYQSLDWLTRIIDVWVDDGVNEGMSVGHWEQRTESYQDWVTHTVGHTREIKTTTDALKLSTVLVPDTGTATTTTETPVTIGNAVLGGDQPWSRRVETREDGVLVSTLIDYDPVLNTIAENSVAAAVGTLRIPAVAAGITRTYTVSDSRFEVVGTDLRLKAGKSLDFETPADATLTVLVTAVDSNQVTHNQYIRVSTTDIAERPTALTLSATKVARNSAGAIVGNVQVSDQDAGSSWTYAVSDSRFYVDGNKKLRLKSGVSIATVDPATWLELNVTATDQTGLKRTQAFSVLVADSANNTVAHTDTVDQGRLLKQSIDLGNGTEQRLTFDADDSQVWSLQSQLWKKGYSDPVANSSYDQTVMVTETRYRDVDVWVVDGVGDEGGTYGHWETHSEPYEVQVPTTVHHTVLKTTTYDARQLNGHTLNDDNSVVAGPTDSTADGQPVSGGDQPWWKKITTVDNGTLVLTEYVYDPLAVAINEAQAGVTIATLPFVAAASGVTRTLSVNDPRFEIASGKLKLKSDQSFDFETSVSTSVIVTATDSNGVVNTLTVAIAVKDLNEAPTNISLSAAVVAEKRPGAVIGTLSGVDLDAGDHLKFSVTDSRFEIVNGQLKLRALEYLDYAATPTVNVAVTATDDKGLVFTKTFTITVDVNDAPTNLALSAATVSENAPGAAIGTLTVTDPDAGDSHVFSVSDDRFEVVNGQLKLKAGQALDFEAAASVPVVVTATDRGGLSFQKTFTVTVVNKNNDGNETLNSTTANNILDGGPGIDTASFSTATAAQPLVIDLQAGTATGHGTDTLISIEKVIGGAGNDQIAGSAADETLNGGAGDDVLDGRAGDDTLNGGLGNDTINGGFGNDTADYYSAATTAVIVNLMTGTATGGQGNDTLSGIENVTGGSGADTLTLSAVGGTLRGNAGNDILTGGDGDDTIYGDGDKDSLVGGGGNDTLYGGNDDDALTGDLGIDTLVGGAGNDTYNVNGSGTVIVEVANQGTDYANVFVNGYTMAANVEAVTLKLGASLFFGNNTGSSIRALAEQATTIYAGDGQDLIYGSEQGDTLYGGGGNDTIFGYSGDDVMIGGGGDDAFNGGGGINTVDYTGVTAALVINLAAMTASGDGQDTLVHVQRVIGGSGNDTIIGNTAVNTLIGGDGNDTLQGADGNDFLIGGRGDDVLDGGAGVDTADYSAVTAALTVDLVAGTASGDGSDTFVGIEWVYGGSGNDLLVGNSGANKLVGGAGDDVLKGGAGNDTLDGGNGVDAVDFSGASANVSINLTTGVATGDGSDTLLNVESAIGGAGNDTITGNSGDNFLVGGGGNDTLRGEGGVDTFGFGRGDGNDRVYASVGDGADTVKFDSTVHYDQLWFQQAGNDLVISVIGEAQAITVNGWYAAPDSHLGAIVSGDGYSITDTGIQQLVAAMVSLTPPSAGTTSLPPATASALATTLTANWHPT